ncbi:MAG: LicD family protein [Coriobacteriales bacterium]|nr:LicD family protein [Coriobacteriales bacterium]
MTKSKKNIWIKPDSKTGSFNKRTIKHIKKIELKILDEFIRVCKKNNLTYFMVGGSLLGTIRHNGFIPWDDDIDVGMPRPDYEKLTKIAKKEFKKHYFLQNYTTEPQCGMIFSRLINTNTSLKEYYNEHLDIHRGIFIDIFPFDKASNDINETIKIGKEHKLLQALYCTKCGYSFPQNRNKLLAIPYTMSKVPLSLIDLNTIIKRIDMLSKKYDKENTQYYVAYIGTYGVEKEIMPACVIDELKTANFEGRKVKIFKYYDYYLSSLYGQNYMMPPPKEKRRGGMHFIKEICFNLKDK